MTTRQLPRMSELESDSTRFELFQAVADFEDDVVRVAEEGHLIDMPHSDMNQTNWCSGGVSCYVCKVIPNS